MDMSSMTMPSLSDEKKTDVGELIGIVFSWFLAGQLTLQVSLQNWFGVRRFLWDGVFANHGPCPTSRSRITSYHLEINRARGHGPTSFPQQSEGQHMQVS